MACIDMTAFRACEHEGYITCRSHPVHDLLIWNYTPRAQYERYWTPETLMCRGLITTPDGTIVARPFPKFFNYEEYTGEIPSEPFEVTEKMDGSLIIICLYKGEQIVATRGTFMSSQAAIARDILHEKYSHLILSDKSTYLFELVCRENRIVVDYGQTRDLFLITIRNTKTGQESTYEELKQWASLYGFPVVKRYDGINDLREITQKRHTLS